MKECEYMKKFIISVFVVIFLIGLSWFLILKFQFDKVSISEEQQVDVRNIKWISIQTDSADMKIIPYEGDKISVSVSGEMSKKLNEQYRLNIIENGDKLEILYLPEGNKLGILLGSEKDVDVTVSLPNKVYRELMISSASGDIDSKGIKAENLGIESSSGEVILQDSQLEGNLIIQSTSGDVLLEQNKINEFTIESSSGKVDFVDVTSNNGQIQTVSGKVIVVLQEAMNDLHIKTTSGDIDTSFEQNPKSLTFKYKGTSGKPILELDGIVYEVKNEHHVVGMIGNGENILTVESASGDFTAK